MTSVGLNNSIDIDGLFSTSGEGNPNFYQHRSVYAACQDTRVTNGLLVKRFGSSISCFPLLLTLSPV